MSILGPMGAHALIATFRPSFTFQLEGEIYTVVFIKAPWAGKLQCCGHDQS